MRAKLKIESHDSSSKKTPPLKTCTYAGDIPATEVRLTIAPAAAMTARCCVCAFVCAVLASQLPSASLARAERSATHRRQVRPHALAKETLDVFGC